MIPLAFHPLWLPPPWWIVFPRSSRRQQQVAGIQACLQPDGGFGNWQGVNTSYLECCFQAFVALNALDAVDEFNVELVRSFLLDREIPSGGFADDPSGYPTLFNTFYGAVCLNMLGIIDNCAQDEHSKFVERYRNYAAGQLSYRCELEWVPDLIATYWAVTARYLLSGIDDPDANALAAYVEACWDDDAGAFGATPGHPAYLEYTYCALCICSLIDIPLPHSLAERIAAFIGSTYDPADCLFGERPGAKGTLSDTMWATACLAMLGSTDAVDLRGLKRHLRELNATELWHLHCQLLIGSYLDEEEPETQAKIVGIDHVPEAGGYAVVTTAFHNRSVVGAPVQHVDVTNATVTYIGELLDGLERMVQTSAPPRELASALKDLSSEVGAALLPSRLFGGAGQQESCFLELTSEPQLLSMPLELALVSGEHVGSKLATGRLIRSDRPAGRTSSADVLSPGAIRVLLLGGNYTEGSLALTNVANELDLVEQQLAEVGMAHVTRLEGEALTRQALRRLLTSDDAEAWTIVHFSGHTFAATAAANSVAAGIVLSDGPLEARILLEWIGGKRPRLVFVNGCASGRVRIASLGPFGLANTGIASVWAEAGVPYMGSYWSIRDNAGAAFASEFYYLVARGLPLGEALRQARGRMRGRGHAAVSWSAFSLVGNPRERLCPYRFSP